MQTHINTGSKNQTLIQIQRLAFELIVLKWIVLLYLLSSILVTLVYNSWACVWNRHELDIWLRAGILQKQFKKHCLHVTAEFCVLFQKCSGPDLVTTKHDKKPQIDLPLNSIYIIFIDTTLWIFRSLRQWFAYSCHFMRMNAWSGMSYKLPIVTLKLFYIFVNFAVSTFTLTK